MAERWAEDGGMPRDRFGKKMPADTSRIMADIRRSNGRIRTFRVQWVLPLKTNEQALGLNLASEEIRPGSVTGLARTTKVNNFKTNSIGSGRQRIHFVYSDYS